MEDTLSSSMNKALASKGTIDSPEESGWTAYFEDFSSNNAQHSSCSSFVSSSLVSDAASCAAWKISDIDHVAACSLIPGSPKVPKKLSFKKTRTKEIFYDDSLEDTASSPVNSPKVSNLKPKVLKPKKKDDHINHSLGKRDDCSELQTEKRNELNFNGMKNNDCMELKKRGLCLVPLSMLVNYLG